MILPEYVGEGEAGSSAKEYDPDDRDPMFEEAARLNCAAPAGFNLAYSA
jgi:S-DNA-T family DNA segregation ATPase FtsK/SpoIIIE